MEVTPTRAEEKYPKIIYINSIKWEILLIEPDMRLEDAYGKCDNARGQIAVDRTLDESRLSKTLLHELTHAYLFSHYPKQDSYNEEYLCEFIALYGSQIVGIAREIVKRRREE